MKKPKNNRKTDLANDIRKATGLDLRSLEKMDAGDLDRLSFEVQDLKDRIRLLNLKIENDRRLNDKAPVRD
jgi:hypothetical protein